MAEETAFAKCVWIAGFSQAPLATRLCRRIDAAHDASADAPRAGRRRVRRCVRDTLGHRRLSIIDLDLLIGNDRARRAMSGLITSE